KRGVKPKSEPAPGVLAPQGGGRAAGVSTRGSRALDAWKCRRKSALLGEDSPGVGPPARTPREVMSRPLSADVSTAGVSRGKGPPQGSRLVPALTLVSHPQAHRVGERLLLEGLSAGRQLLVSRNEPDFTRPGGGLGMHLADPFLSRKPLVFALGAQGGI